ESIVRRFEGVGEFAIHARRDGELDSLEVHIEADSEATSDAVSGALRTALGLRVGVQRVAAGSLPRFDLKARRVTDHRV
ncbi:MAG: phenylacetate--CoA ligase family protein, partial [Candidatus Poribacteria bacterium]